MTTTLTTDLTTTLTSSVDRTQTAIIKGVLDITVTQTVSSADVSSTPSSELAITLANKAVSSVSETDLSATTISTMTSSSTSTSTATSTASSTSTSDSSGSVSGTFLSQNTSGTTNSNIGLVIGIPVAVIGSVLMILALWFYIRRRRNLKQAADARLESRYDEKFNYKISPLEETSPYNLRSMYQVRAKETQPYTREEFSLAPGSKLHSLQNNQSELSLKEPPTGPVNSRWNLNTPLSRWFAKHSQVSSANTSRGSLSTAPFSPIVALKEFKLHKSKRSEINEKSPILPRFPETSYHPNNYHSTKASFSSDDSTGSIKTQVVPMDYTRKITVPKLQPVAPPKKKKLRSQDKPLPEKPAQSASSLEGLEKIVYERMIPTTPKVDFKKYKDDSVYKVVTQYNKNLADEITITPGEYVKVLARHTDGWCLVEKVDKNGNPLDGKTGVGSHSYLNDSRGVIPAICLGSLK